jgi:hypothetical protein
MVMLIPLQLSGIEINAIQPVTVNLGLFGFKICH